MRWTGCVVYPLRTGSLGCPADNSAALLPHRTMSFPILHLSHNSFKTRFRRSWYRVESRVTLYPWTIALYVLLLFALLSLSTLFFLLSSHSRSSHSRSSRSLLSLSLISCASSYGQQRPAKIRIRQKISSSASRFPFCYWTWQSTTFPSPPPNKPAPRASYVTKISEI